MGNGKVTVLIKHHCQPPIETPAMVWDQVIEFDPDTPIRQVFESAYSMGDVLTVILPKQS